MRTHQGIVAALVIGLIGVSLPCLGGTPMDAERAVDELKLMTTPELAGEARISCRLVVTYLESAQRYSAGKFYDQAIENRNLAFRKQQYLQRVGLVIREREHGQMPSWFEAIAASKTREDCDTAATAGGWRPKQ